MTTPRRLMMAATLLGSVTALAAHAYAETPEAATTRAEIRKTFGFLPGFLKQMPDLVLPGFWQEMSGLEMNPGTALPGKAKELISLAVAAQIPCEYCIYAHTEFAKLNGATQAELGEAVGMAALTRHWSTFLNGMQMDEGKFRAEIKQVITNLKKMAAGGAATPKPIPVTDARTALEDVKQTMGFVPEFIQKFPPEGIAGAWNTMKSLDMNPQTAIPGKHKALIGLAVAAQVPCKFCVIADTEFAKLEGATDREIAEAVAMASLTRAGSTVLNGLQIDRGAFRKDIDKLVVGARKHMTMGGAEKGKMAVAK
jgi:AhpD family alkylhydroperoxidase